MVGQLLYYVERPTKYDNYKTPSCTLVINDYKITLTRVRLDLTKHNRHIVQ